MTRERQDNIIMAAEAIGLIRDCMGFRNRGFEKDLADLNRRLNSQRAQIDRVATRDLEAAHRRVRVTQLWSGAGVVEPA